MATPKNDGIVWEEPLEVRGGRPSKWITLLAPLVAQPNRWARVRECPSSATAFTLASKLNHGKAGYRIPSGRWEFAGRRNGDKGYVYARYLGPEDES